MNLKFLDDRIWRLLGEQYFSGLFFEILSAIIFEVSKN